MTQPCDLHELSPCGTCNGAEARLNASLATPRGEYEPGTRIAPGVVAASYPGICTCGQNFGIGSPVRWDERRQGWQATGCCG